MKFLHRLMLAGLFIAMLMSQPAISQTKPVTTPVKLTSVEGITEYKLSNGLHVLLFPDPSKPTITVNITYLVGSRLEGYGETGMAHLLEHMMFKGSAKHTNIPKELSDHGANPNGTTWYDRTNYFETFSATDENLKWALDLESDRMIHSFIANKDLQSEFSVVRNEFEMGENSPSNILQERVISTAYLWHNYGKSTIGSKEDIERVPIERLQAFYKKYYQPDNAVLVVAGKIDEPKVLQLVNQYFGSIAKPTRKIDPAYTVEPEQDGERSVVLRRVGDVQVVAAAYHVPSSSHKDYATLDVLNDVLTNAPSGRLYKALVETQKASNQSGFIQPLKDPGFIYFSADVLKEKSLDEAKNTLLGILDSLTLKPVTKDEVDRAKNKLLKDFEELYRNSEDVGLALSEFIASGDWRLGFIYRDNLKKVNPEDVNRVAALYFKPSNRTIGLFYPEKNPDRSIIPASPDVAALVKGYKGEEGLAKAEAFDVSPANIDKRTKSGSIPGGGKYSILTKTTRGNTVNISISLRMGNEQTLQNKATIAELTASMLNRGTKTFTREQLKDTLNKLKAQVNVNGSAGVTSVTIQTVKENLPKVLTIVNEILHQPTFPQNEFDALKTQEIASIEQQKSEPQSIAVTTAYQKLSPYAKGHPNYVMSFEEQTEAIKLTVLADLKQFYQDYYNSADATASVVGDCDETSTIQQLTAILQNWKSKNPFKHIDKKFFDVKPEDIKIKTPDKKNAMFISGMNLPIRDDDADYAALTIGNYILGGGFLNSRLANRIRQKEGLSYGVGSFVNAGSLDRTGMFLSYAIYNPANVDKLDSAYKQEINKILKDGITAEELKAAKTGYLQNEKVEIAQDNVLATKLNGYLFLKRTMTFDEKFDTQINNLTVEQVNTALRKYINPDKILYVKAGDFK
jgi:zinc protease